MSEMEPTPEEMAVQMIAGVLIFDKASLVGLSPKDTAKRLVGRLGETGITLSYNEEFWRDHEDT